MKETGILFRGDMIRAGTDFAWEKNPWVWVIEFREVK